MQASGYSWREFWWQSGVRCESWVGPKDLRWSGIRCHTRSGRRVGAVGIEVRPANRRERLGCFGVSSLAAVPISVSDVGKTKEHARRVSVNNARRDGSVKQIFGPNPLGVAMFDARGNTAVVLMRAG